MDEDDLIFGTKRRAARREAEMQAFAAGMQAGKDEDLMAMNEDLIFGSQRRQARREAAAFAAGKAAAADDEDLGWMKHLGNAAWGAAKGGLHGLASGMDDDFEIEDAAFARVANDLGWMK